MNDPAPPHRANVRLTLHPDAVAHPVHRAAKIATEFIPHALAAIEKADLSAPPLPPGGFGFQINNTAMSDDETRSWYKNWLLTRGVQDLAKGVRQMLEEAYCFTRIYALPAGQSTWGELQGEIAAIRNKANKPSFPDLLQAVNAHLLQPLHFEREFMSLQAVRNCLEHRAGIVDQQDIDDGCTTLTLALPRMGIFVHRAGNDVEVTSGSQLAKGEEVFVTSVVRERHFELGESIQFDQAQLVEAAYGCYAFSVDLISKLPQRTAL